ncbi:MAG: DUF5011 domain-containing protein [Clostridia bacterium]|nr:DUF5011 domain-containing protein [Clostridia bacterium]
MRKNYRLIAAFCACLLLVSLLCACGGSDENEISLPTPKALKWAVGAPLPDAEEFFDTLPAGASVRFASEPDFSSMGEHTLAVIYTDADGNESEISVSLTLAIDTAAPTIIGAKDLSVCLGEGIAYRSGVTVTDDFDGEITLEVDSSAVKPTEEGNYPVTYTARDSAGNTKVVTVTVWIYREKVTEAMLWEYVDDIIRENSIDEFVSRERQAREVFDYVYYNISYDSTSDKTDWVRAAYEGLKNGKGDCYTYFAISKAFFERLGLQNMDVKRTEGIVTERHYWNLVNIGTADAPLWYHFDACRLSGVIFRGCLLTDAQLAEYTAGRINENGDSNYFYVFDGSALPARATAVITDPYHY